MKIRIEITPPREPFRQPGSSIFIWNVESIDEFIERFIQDDRLIIGKSEKERWDWMKDEPPDNSGIRMPITDLTKHSEKIATFKTEHVNDYICIVFALGDLKAPDVPEGMHTFHNITVNTIADDQDPLKPVPKLPVQDWDEVLVEAATALERRQNKQ